MASEIPPLQYVPVDGAESLGRYKERAYHPVKLGGRLAFGRCEILNKLGFGSYSTVWLARDEPKQRYVAVKIKVASLPNEDARELEICQQLAVAAAGHRSGKDVLRTLDAFFVAGANGRHECFVSVPGGSSLGVQRTFGFNLSLSTGGIPCHLRANDTGHGVCAFSGNCSRRSWKRPRSLPQARFHVF